MILSALFTDCPEAKHMDSYILIIRGLFAQMFIFRSAGYQI